MPAQGEPWLPSPSLPPSLRDLPPPTPRLCDLGRGLDLVSLFWFLWGGRWP